MIFKQEDTSSIPGLPASAKNLSFKSSTILIRISSSIPTEKSKQCYFHIHVTKCLLVVTKLHLCKDGVNSSRKRAQVCQLQDP